jgi:TIGR00255 family protein
MTGYGKSEAVFEGKKIHVEIKSLNSKSLDLSTRIAPLYREKEIEIRKMVAAALERGKVDMNVWVEKTLQSSASINEEAVQNYVQQIRQISQNCGISEPQNNWWEVMVRLPETLLSSQVETLDEAEWEVVKKAIEEALDNLQDFRRQEGAALEQKFTQKLDNIECLLKQIETYETTRVAKIKERIISGLSELKAVAYDQNRLEQELIYYIEKLDISEEKQRLANHLKYFRETMADGHAQGKKLGFIAQEMGREINTTGSKSNQAEMQNIVVKMKDELEQIKEQVLNAL